LESAAVVNLLEADLAPLPVQGSSVEVLLKPFQIVTLRVRPAGGLQGEQAGQAGLIDLSRRH
jgi:hypothetical protein